MLPGGGSLSSLVSRMLFIGDTFSIRASATFPSGIPSSPASGMLPSGGTLSSRASATFPSGIPSRSVSETFPRPDRLRIVNAVVQ